MPSFSLPSANSETWLSRRRLDVYLNATSGDLVRALSLYDWNSQATAAILQDLGHLEVLIRNRYDVVLTSRDPNWTLTTSPIWALEVGHPQARAVQRSSNNYSKKVLATAARKAPQPTHGHIIANLTFGFWTALTQAEREPTIWTPLISTLFPGKPRGPVHDDMEKLNNFRNRLAHWEPVFSRTTGLLHQLQLIDTVAAAMDPQVATWIGSTSRVVGVLSRMPEPVLSLGTGHYLGESFQGESVSPPVITLANKIRALFGRRN